MMIRRLKVWSNLFVYLSELAVCFFIPSCWRKTRILHFIVHIGIGSLPLILLCTTVAGIVITKELAWHLDLALHTLDFMPGFMGQMILREIGVVIPAFLMVSKVGAATTAEVGHMKMTEQIDALILLGIRPVEYLLFPRLIASILSGLCLTLIAVGSTLACSSLFAVYQYHFPGMEFMNALCQSVGTRDLICALVKGGVYGALIPVVSCYYAFHCENSAEGVGKATTQSVVTSTLAIILLDFILTYIFTWIL